jgi:hypothetical protein
MNRIVLVSLTTVLLSVLGEACDAQQASTPAARDSTRKAVITYISGQSIYVSAGELDGVREGTLLDVFRGASIIAQARAAFLSSHSSSCEIVRSTAAPVVGDSVRYLPASDRRAAVAADPVRVQSRPRAQTGTWGHQIRGHVGVRYSSVSQPYLPDGAGLLTQPSAELRVQGTSLARGLIDFVIDGRSRTTLGQRGPHASALDGRALVYQASLSTKHAASGARLSVGRQYSSALSPVGLFDGVTAELNRARWGVGVFSAVQPDVATMQFSTAVHQAGGYAEVRSRPDEALRWSVTSGAIGSRNSGQLDRRFGFTQVTLGNPWFSLYAAQEVDFNSGWKRAAGEAAVSLTSTFASLSLRPVDELSIQAGIDNRRSVRLYRDYVNPVTEFDDAFRQGVWSGANYSFRGIRVGADARFSQGGPAGRASQVSGSLALPHLPHRLDLRLRSTGYHTDRTSGWLNALTASVDPLDVLHLELDGGVRTQHAISAFDSTTTLLPLNALSDGAWIGLSADVNVTRSWYLLLSASRDYVGLDPTNLVYWSIVYRF